MAKQKVFDVEINIDENILKRALDHFYTPPDGFDVENKYIYIDDEIVLEITDKVRVKRISSPSESEKRNEKKAGVKSDERCT